jgi:hypothetical protein
MGISPYVALVNFFPSSPVVLVLVVVLVLESAGKIRAEQSCQLIDNAVRLVHGFACKTSTTKNSRSSRNGSSALILTLSRVRESAPDVTPFEHDDDDDEHEDDREKRSYPLLPNFGW